MHTYVQRAQVGPGKVKDGERAEDQVERNRKGTRGVRGRIMASITGT